MRRKTNIKIGLTTGACAQAAAKGCALMLVSGSIVNSVEIELPNGENRAVRLIKQKTTKKYAGCAVIKDSGEEDKDVTNGIEIACEIREAQEPGIALKGGRGVGKVTRPGLPVDVGEWAINPAPRKMIMRDVFEVLPEMGGYVVEISVPEGERIAEQTYNPRLGIEGGISIIGTSGLVKPKSQESYKKSLLVELNVAIAAGYKAIFIASGYLGERLLTENYNVPQQQIIKAGDHIGFMLEECAAKGVAKAMLIGHIGKLSKVAAGLFNTHYKTGDARLETIAAYAALNGAGQGVVKELLGLRLAEAAIDVLKNKGLMAVFDDIAGRAAERAIELCKGSMEVAVAILSLKGEIIGRYPEDIFEGETWEKFIS